MNNVMEVVDIEQGTPEWLEWRKTGVTATCAPVLMGASGAMKTPYELYLLYTGMIVPEDLSVIKQVRSGIINEPLARAWAERERGQLGLPLCVRNKHHPYMIASLDGFFDDGYLLEIKNLATQKHLEIITSGSKSKEFRYYYWQVQHQLLVSGAPGAFLLFWSSKETPKTFLIKPNHEIHAKLIDASKKFYDCVKDRVAPPFDDEKDVLLISDAEIMKQTKGFSIPSDLDVRIAKIRSNVIELEKAKAEVNRLEALTKADISGLSVALGFKQGKPVRIDGFGVRYLESVSQGSLNWKSVALKLSPNANQEIYPDCVNAPKITSRLTTYEYKITGSDSIAVVVPDSVKSQSHGIITTNHGISSADGLFSEPEDEFYIF